MHIEMVDPEGQILGEIADKRLKQADVALTYAFCMRQGGVDFAKVNMAIMERWSLSGLKRVKEMAWKRVEGRRAAS